MSMIETKMMGALGRFLDVDVARLKLIGSGLSGGAVAGGSGGIGGGSGRAFLCVVRFGSLRACGVRARFLRTHGEAGARAARASRRK